MRGSPVSHVKQLAQDGATFKYTIQSCKSDLYLLSYFTDTSKYFLPRTRPSNMYSLLGSIYRRAFLIIWTSCFPRCIRRIIPHDIHFSYQNQTPNRHRNSNNRKVYSCKLMAFYMNVLSSEDIPPKKTSQRCAKSRAERAVVDAKSHTVNRSPVCSISNETCVNCTVYFFPGLDDT